MPAAGCPSGPLPGAAIRIDMQMETVIARWQTGEIRSDLQTRLRVRQAERADLKLPSVPSGATRKVSCATHWHSR
jgi:hypothetical protein